MDTTPSQPSELWEPAKTLAMLQRRKERAEAEGRQLGLPLRILYEALNDSNGPTERSWQAAALAKKYFARHAMATRSACKAIHQWIQNDPAFAGRLLGELTGLARRMDEAGMLSQLTDEAARVLRIDLELSDVHGLEFGSGLYFADLAARWLADPVKFNRSAERKRSAGGSTASEAELIELRNRFGGSGRI